MEKYFVAGLITGWITFAIVFNFFYNRFKKQYEARIEAIKNLFQKALITEKEFLNDVQHKVSDIEKRISNLVHNKK